MKKVLLTTLFAAFALGAFAQSDSYFGEKINDKGAVTATELPKKMGSKEKMTAKVTGTVDRKSVV